ncbi:helicase associated domain-containing protein, partial [Streptomyces canus]|uniref:helicase associated domain-containing protein n=1 Tax=Streptomyces canus TaxID=58343 RepID=UPI00371B36A5
LTAMERHKDADPAMAAVLAAIKATVKGGIGKWLARHRTPKVWQALTDGQRERLEQLGITLLAPAPPSRRRPRSRPQRP